MVCMESNQMDACKANNIFAINQGFNQATLTSGFLMSTILCYYL